MIMPASVNRSAITNIQIHERGTPKTYRESRAHSMLHTAAPMKSTKKSLLLAAVALLAFVGTAVAAGTVSVTLTPKKAGKGSKFHITASGFTSSQGIPTSVAVFTQRGFKADPKAVAVLCTSAQASTTPPSCPSKSQIGSGSALIHIVALGQGTDVTIPLTIFLGTPSQSGDLASVILTGTATFPLEGKQTLTATGRLIKNPSSAYGLEILFDKFSSPTIPSGVTVTLTKLDLSGGAFRTVKKGKQGHKHKVRLSLLTNPKTCTGSWTGKFTATFATGPALTVATSTPCKK
jgi:hypothetical protein